ncbi:MAG: spore coat associated protein CotJA [Fusicatenibacter sp.]|nr:spore coat associated protein CotJA [Lachnospiraceae bacterium]MDY2938405.1 spore coat associated protein CotJA [Fusicatenibacter sp.]
MEYSRMNRSSHQIPGQQMAMRQGMMSECKMSDSSVSSAKMVPAMAYVPMQQFEQTYDLAVGFQMGTIFPELCKPFCGKGGRGCR